MIAAALAEQGASVIPADLQSAEVWPVAAPYREAFGILSATRARSEVGPMPIPYTEILAYSEANGFSESITEQQEFVRLVQAQDAAFMENAAKQLERIRQNPKAS